MIIISNNFTLLYVISYCWEITDIIIMQCKVSMSAISLTLPLATSQSFFEVFGGIEAS